MLICCCCSAAVIVTVSRPCQSILFWYIPNTARTRTSRIYRLTDIVVRCFRNNARHTATRCERLGQIHQVRFRSICRALTFRRRWKPKLHVYFDAPRPHHPHTSHARIGQICFNSKSTTCRCVCVCMCVCFLCLFVTFSRTPPTVKTEKKLISFASIQWPAELRYIAFRVNSLSLPILLRRHITAAAIAYSE